MTVACGTANARIPTVFPLLAITVDGRWNPGIGDPTPLGWFTVALYALATLLTFTASRRSAADRFPWRTVSALLAILTINKALDLQSFFTQTGRALAQSTGLYADHRALQYATVSIIALLGLVLAATLPTLFLRRHPSLRPRHHLAIIALVYQVAFIVIRAISLHPVDHVLGLSAGPVRMNHVLEWLGPCAIMASAAIEHRTLAQPPPVPQSTSS